MPDAVVVGAGPNGLAAAIALARAGRSVRVLEVAETIGGGSRSAELTLPGFVHDVCSAVHPHPLASPFLRELPLAEHGLELVHPERPLAHPLDEGTAVVLDRSVGATAASIGGADGEAYRKLLVQEYMGQVLTPSVDVVGDITQDHIKIVDAFEHGDFEALRRIIAEHTDHAKATMRAGIEKPGG